MPEPESVSFDGDITQLASTAIQFHELFLELKRAGFAHNDAVQIIAVIMSNSLSFDDGYNEDFDEDYEDDEDDLLD